MRLVLIPILVLGIHAGSGHAADHPRLFFTGGDVPALREKVKKAPYAAMVELLKADTDKLGAASYDVANAAFAYGFLYQATGDDAYAKKAREKVEAVLKDKAWGNAGFKGLALFMLGSRVAYAYDFCAGSPSWDGEFAKKISAELKRHGEIIVDKGGTEQNNSPSSNWQGARFASGALCLLAMDEGEPDKARLDNCYQRVSRYLSANLGAGAESRGWNGEGLGYTYFPMRNYVGPYAIAVERTDKTRDLRKVVPGSPYALWTVHATVLPFAGIFARPDFGDDNAGWHGEGTYGLAFWWSKPELQPGLVWTYDRVCGEKGRKDYDAMRTGTVWSILCHPGTAVAEKDPMTIPEWTAAFADRGGIGYQTFRNHYKMDGIDIVCQLNAKTHVPGGHGGPDSLGIRILGLKGAFVVGGGRYGVKGTGGTSDAYWQSQSSLYATDPGAKLDLGKLAGAKLLGTTIAPDGGGTTAASASASSTDLNVNDQVRRVGVDFKASGAAAAFIIADTSANGKFFQLATLGINTVTTGADTFTITTPEGATMQGTIVHPKGAKITTGKRSRGSIFSINNEKDNGFVLIEGDGAFVVALTMQPKGSAHPAVKAAGTWAGAPDGSHTSTSGHGAASPLPMPPSFSMATLKALGWNWPFTTQRLRPGRCWAWTRITPPTNLVKTAAAM